MAQEMVSLVVVTVLCVVLPLVILGVLVGKNREQRKEIVALFLCGAVIYAVMQWGIKEHGLAWLFNHTSFVDFMNAHYIPYLLVVALAGAILTVLVQMFVVNVPFKKNISFVKAIAFGLGYGMLESVLLIGLNCINIIIELIKGTELELGMTTIELLLSGYERILMMIIEIAVGVVMIYFIEKGMSVRGGVIAVVCYMLAAFLPGFFIAFSLTDYYEVYNRTFALTLVYVVLTAAAVTSIVVLNAFKYQLKD